jgi:hypothetical protein
MAVTPCRGLATTESDFRVRAEFQRRLQAQLARAPTRVYSTETNLADQTPRPATPNQGLRPLQRRPRSERATDNHHAIAKASAEASLWLPQTASTDTLVAFPPFTDTISLAAIG